MKLKLFMIGMLITNFCFGNNITYNETEAFYNPANILNYQEKFKYIVKFKETGEEKEYREALKINPNYAQAHYNLGNVLYNQGNLLEAEEEYREALKIDPNLAEAHNNLGGLLYNQGKLLESEEEYREPLKIDTNNE